MKKMKVLFTAVLFVLSLSVAVYASPEGHGGGNDGDGAASSSSRITKTVMRAASIYVKDGDCSKFMPIASKYIDKVDEEEKGGIMYLMSNCYFKGGNYDKGKAMIMDILKTKYDSVTSLLGDREKVRTLAAALFSREAAKKGEVKDIQEVQKIVDKDSNIDRLFVRDTEGSLVSRTKLSYVLKFHEAQAYKNSSKAKEALSILRELSFSSGKIMVDGKIEGLREAVQKMTNEIQSTAMYLIRRILAS